MYLCQKYKHIINFSTELITFKFELVSVKQTNSVYLTEIIITDLLQILYGLWEEIDTPYSYDFYLWLEWLFRYYNELPLDEDIESTYLMWKSEQ